MAQLLCHHLIRKMLPGSSSLAALAVQGLQAHVAADAGAAVAANATVQHCTPLHCQQQHCQQQQPLASPHQHQQQQHGCLHSNVQQMRWSHSAACNHNHDHPHTHDHSSPQAATFEEQEATCWSCHDRFHRGGLVCQACDKIQPSDPTLTHFDILGIQQPSFDLEPAALEKRYKLLQWQLHPDKAVNRSPQEQQFSAEQATRVNQAYGVLRHPLSRANYLLLLGGVSAEEHLEGTIADPELLMEVMEAREEVEAEQDQERLVKLHTSNKQREAAVCQELSQAFAAGDLERARQLTAQLSYWVRLEEAIAAKL